MDVSTFKLPPILPSSNTTINSDRTLNVKLDTNSYEQWRVNIHKQLEEDLQRQVRELLEETERQQCSTKAKGKYLGCDQYIQLKQQENIDILSEINRRNENVLHPVKSKERIQSENDQSLKEFSNKPFYLNSYHSYRPLGEFSKETDDENYMNPSMYFTKYTSKQSSVVSINSDSSMLFGNSILKSNKATILNIFDQQFLNGNHPNTHVNKYGIIMDVNGPFWPENYRILHSTPKLLNRELTPKEFYFLPNMSGKKTKI